MKQALKNSLLVAAALTSFGATVAGCSYGGVGVAGTKAVIVRNDMFLFGALRSAYVCDVTDAGLKNCQEGDAP